MSLSSLLGKKAVEKHCHPLHFYLDRSTFNAQWVNLDKIEKHCWKAEYELKGIGIVILVSDYLPQIEYIKSDILGINSSYYCSHLKKCIMGNQRTKALKTATQLFLEKPYELLSLLSVVTLEKSIPLEGYSTLVWLTMATQLGYKMDFVHLGWILGYVYDITNCNYYDIFSTQVEKISLSSLRLYKLNQNAKNLCYSIVLRNTLNRKTNDKKICQKALLLWIRRFRSKSTFISLLNREQIFISPPIQPHLDTKEWLIETVDSTVYQGITNYLWERNDDNDIELIGKAIDKYTNKTKKKPLLSNAGACASASASVDPDLENLIAITWENIKKDYYSIARFFIKTYSIEQN
jgi:hypothetical protein